MMMATCTKCGADSNHVNDVGVCPAEFDGGWIDNVKEGDRFRINKPVPATWLERDNKSSSSPSYTLKEIEALAREWVKSQEGDIDMLDWTFSIWLEWLAKREREGLDG